ncbi:UDP-N-acetylmuramoyl-tripeptide--D-alanyl-D-alanine ligase [Marinobacter sp. X15-166B]|uniref:UDP-N-acetylmuramoyl-tripeptide--D-alanyl-D- alanine ligase n=1 Tax=Marinobacter sp. X15-166B TaxID=1897620 RepID=UPI00085C2BAF|nr:UDP-N-acetylmuramoyl-tripeptide--D-alanyl-D-alanine ligase [Marinobacter sp. X15-166B]OEY66694.1 UDP-N-acetylmuramoylalanyl-D-glutamyl-2, 6-diaminopimelate--D-alanyl-D-alanine ligase [Marinobacter sp. X15-166B]
MMSNFTLAQAAGWLGADPAGLTGDRQTEFSDVFTDTRNGCPGALFVALRGENFDGHRFLQAAKDAGAVAAVVDQFQRDVALPQLVVPDTVHALAILAGANRNAATLRVAAITGSSGKTTVKEMLAAILAQAGETLATQGNLNNHIGAPLTLLRLSPHHRFAVIELGASGLGEIAHTVAITRPDVAIITNASEAHLEGFGGYQNIVTAKGEIIDGVGVGGAVILSADDPAYAQWRQRAGERTVISVSGAADSQADYSHELLPGSGETQAFRVLGPEGWTVSVSLALQGSHNIVNALLATAAARQLGVDRASIAAGLAAVTPVKGRLHTRMLTTGVTLIDDSYNANPASLKAALGVLAAADGQRIAVLGAMAELGAESMRLHEEVGAKARALGIERLIVVGPGGEGYASGFGEQTEHCDTHAAAIEYLAEQVLANPSTLPATLLLKGSRSSAMDVVADGLLQKVKSTCCSG